MNAKTKELTATSPQTEDQVQGRLFLDVVVRKSAAIFQLLACKDEPLLVRGDAFFILDLGLHVLNGVTGLHLQGDGLAGQGLHKDLHFDLEFGRQKISLSLQDFHIYYFYI